MKKAILIKKWYSTCLSVHLRAIPTELTEGGCIHQKQLVIHGGSRAYVLLLNIHVDISNILSECSKI